MPLIRFETKKDEGSYLLVTSGEVGWFPDGVFGVTEHLLQQLEPRFREKGIRYHRLSAEEANAAAPFARNLKRKTRPAKCPTGAGS